MSVQLPSSEVGAAELAELYDLDTGWFEDDLPFYESLVRQAGGPVLELGAGTGRVALHLARAGHDVWGIDTNDAMLERACCKAGDAVGARFVVADMRDFALDRKFALIYAGFGAFHHLLTTGDQLACLRCVERHLTDEGRLVFDLRAIFATDWEEGDSVPLLHDWTRELPAGKHVTKLRSVRVDRAAQVQHETYYFDRVAADGTLRRVTTNVDLRFSTRYEIEGLLRETGLAVDQVYGDFDLTPFDGASDLMITVARKMRT
jgi:SAM-dependent methyltransferase